MELHLLLPHVRAPSTRLIGMKLVVLLMRRFAYWCAHCLMTIRYHRTNDVRAIDAVLKFNTTEVTMCVYPTDACCRFGH